MCVLVCACCVFTLRSWANRLDTLFPPAAGWMIFNSLPIINKVSEGTYNIYVSMYSSTQNLYLRPCSCFFKFTLKTCRLLQILFITPLCCLLLAVYSHCCLFFPHSTQEKKRKVVKKKKGPQNLDIQINSWCWCWSPWLLLSDSQPRAAPVREGPLWPWYEKELIIDEKPFCQVDLKMSPSYLMVVKPHRHSGLLSKETFKNFFYISWFIQCKWGLLLSLVALECFQSGI